MKTKATFGTRLKSLRESKSLSMPALAEASGLAREYLYRLEADSQSPSWETVKKLADALDVPVETFR